MQTDCREPSRSHGYSTYAHKDVINFHLSSFFLFAEAGLPAKIVKICTQRKFPTIYGNMWPKSENAKRHHRWWYRMKVKSWQSLRIRARGLSCDNQPSIDTCSTNIRELVDSLCTCRDGVAAQYMQCLSKSHIITPENREC